MDKIFKAIRQLQSAMREEGIEIENITLANREALDRLEALAGQHSMVRDERTTQKARLTIYGIIIRPSLAAKSGRSPRLDLI